MGKIYIRTYAYNAEKTLRRAVESVLNQTYSDFVYYLCDNGSTDGTRAIVEEYAKSDLRIKPFYNTVNRAYKETEECLYLPYNIEDDDYFCTLDADDEYKPTFFADMMQFMAENSLDIAVCGSDFLSVAQNDALVSQRLLKQNIILYGRNFADYFPYYHVFMRTTWGKLFKGFTLRQTIQDPSDDLNFPKGYGGDTYNTILTFKSAKRVGIISKSLHKYYLSKKSISYQFNPDRVKADIILYKAMLRYLIHYNALTPQNEDFLLVVYLNALRDTFDVLITAKNDDSNKLNHLFEMLTCQYTTQLATKENLGELIGQADSIKKLRNDLFMRISLWLIKFENVPDDQVLNFCFMGEFCCAVIDFADGWILFKKIHIQRLIDEKKHTEARKELDNLHDILPEDEDFRVFQEQLGML